METIAALTSRIKNTHSAHNEKLASIASLKIELERLENERFNLYRSTNELHNTEIFNVTEGEMLDQDGKPLPRGWYYWYSVPGCLPDSEPFGPWENQEDATIQAYNQQYNDYLETIGEGATTMKTNHENELVINKLAALARAEREKSEKYAGLRDQYLLTASENDENLSLSLQAEKNREISSQAAKRFETLAARLSYLTR